MGKTFDNSNPTLQADGHSATFETVAVGDGTVNAPSYTFTADTMTGMFREQDVANKSLQLVVNADPLVELKEAVDDDPLVDAGVIAHFFQSSDYYTNSVTVSESLDPVSSYVTAAPYTDTNGLTLSLAADYRNGVDGLYTDKDTNNNSYLNVVTLTQFSIHVSFVWDGTDLVEVWAFRSPNDETTLGRVRAFIGVGVLAVLMDDPGSGGNYFIGNLSIPTDTWTHLTVVVDNAAFDGRRIKLYLNGVLTVPAFSAGNLFTAYEPFTLPAEIFTVAYGQSGVEVPPSIPSDILVGDLYITSTALSASEISQLISNAVDNLSAVSLAADTIDLESATISIGPATDVVVDTTTLDLTNPGEIVMSSNLSYDSTNAATGDYLVSLDDTGMCVWQSPFTSQGLSTFQSGSLVGSVTGGRRVVRIAGDILLIYMNISISNLQVGTNTYGFNLNSFIPAPYTGIQGNRLTVSAMEDTQTTARDVVWTAQEATPNITYTITNLEASVFNYDCFVTTVIELEIN